MSEAKHTPGPWEAGSEGSGGNGNPLYVYCDDATGSAVASCDLEYTFHSRKEREANARLIAAAPDMLEALKALVAQVLDYEQSNHLSPNPGRKYCWDVTERAVAAIAKATGETK